MPQPVLALEVDASEIKAAVVEASFRDSRVLGLYREPIVADGSSIAEQLQRFLVKHSLPTQATVLSALPGDVVTWRRIWLPFRDRKRLEQTVPFELEAQVPFGLDEVVIDYHVVARDKAVHVGERVELIDLDVEIRPLLVVVHQRAQVILDQPSGRQVRLGVDLRLTVGSGDRVLHAQLEFFDIEAQGEGLSDVGTHLVDLTQWIAFPDTAIDYRTDIKMLDARRWPTTLTEAQWRSVTGTAPLAPGDFDYYGNNFVSYTLRGIHVQMDVRWDLEGVSDTHMARFRGSKASIEVRQGEAEAYRPEVYIVPNSAELHDEVLAALRAKFDQPNSAIDGVTVEDRGHEFILTIPDHHRVGHEAHFAEVTRQFFAYLHDPKLLPAWEKSNMLAKYYVSTKGVEMAAAKG